MPLCWVMVWGCAAARAASSDRTVDFSFARDVGMGTSVFVAGSTAALGDWGPTAAVKLVWNAGNIWSGAVAVAAGTALEYKYVWRSTATNRFCDPANVTWMEGLNLSTNLPAGLPAPYAGKTLYYYSDWTNVELVYRLGTNWNGAPLTPVGPGYSGGETLHSISGIGAPGEALEFVFNGWSNGVLRWDNAPYANPPSGANNYYTALDVFYVRQGQIHNYRPPAAVGESRKEDRWVDSTVADIPGRAIHIYLPRGYDTNAWKRYPVVYLHDGQNVFSPGGAFGSWDADLTATKEISQGRMRECIIVAMDNTAHRQFEYCPPGDRYSVTTPWGVGDKYLRFVLDNVKPTLDYNYRTLADRDNAMIGGSSMGGLISTYFGYATNAFGIVMAMSPSYSRATNFAAALRHVPRGPRRIYVDTGTAEGLVGQAPGSDYWESPWNGYAAMVRQGYRINDELIMRVGCGHQHNEWAWQQRLPEAFRFLLPLTDEPNRAALQEHPAQLTGIAPSAANEGLAVRFSALPLQQAVVEQADPPLTNWSGIATVTVGDAWAYPVATAGAAAVSGALRVNSTPRY